VWGYSVEQYIRARAAADALAVSVKMVYKLVSRGDLKALRVGRAVSILLASLQEFVTRNTLPAREPRPVAPPPTPPRRRRKGAKGAGFVFLPPARP
jgi:excisionase family DNA binding protein